MAEVNREEERGVGEGSRHRGVVRSSETGSSVGGIIEFMVEGKGRNKSPSVPLRTYGSRCSQLLTALAMLPLLCLVYLA